MANGSIGNLNGKHAFIVALVSAIIGGAGGPLLLVQLGGDSLFRQDPFTGEEGKQLKTQLEYHFRNHPDITNEFDTRITTLEAQNAIIISNQNRIFDRLDRLIEQRK